MNIPQILEDACRSNPDKIFLYFKSARITYKDFWENACRAANWFMKLGIKRGDRVCVSLPNCPEFLYIWLGLSHIGGIIVPINISYKEEESAHILRHSECSALVGNEDTLANTKRVRLGMGHLNHIISTSEAPDPGVLNFRPFMEENSEHSPPVRITEDDISSIMYTSGTTGVPKGVMVTQRAYTCCGQGYTHWADITHQDRLFTCLPLYHANAQYYSTMGSLAAGASLILEDRFSASLFWGQIRSYKATIFNFIGMMVAILMKQPESPDDHENPVRIAYGTPALDKELQDRFEDRFGLTILSGYALTECPFGTIQPLHGIRKSKSIGLPRYHPEFENKIRVVDENGQEVPVGQVGELIIKNPTVTPGYFRNPEETKRAVRDGWLYTGDNASRDEEGYFYFVDRKKDVIRRRGENFSSIEVEDVLNSHPQVLECAVIGIPSELTDEEVKAYVVPRSGEKIEPAELFEWCGKKLAKFKVPRFLEFRDFLPKTPTHRVEKYKLREEKKDLRKGCIDRENLNPGNPNKHGSHWNEKSR
jgi:crotonobetaine/carnitine-CoA ligase